MESPTLEDRPSSPQIITDRSPITSVRPVRMLLLDDDDLFCRAMERVAQDAGIHLTSCGSLEDLTRLASHRGFDVVILDFYLGDLNGAHVASVLGGRPVLLISSEPYPPHTPLPEAVRQFVLKTTGPENILASAILLIPLTTARAENASRPGEGNQLKARILENIRGLTGGGDEYFLGEIVDLFLAQTAATLLRLQAAVKKHELETTTRLIQDLRASCSNVGARPLDRWCARLESQAQRENWVRCRLLVRGLGTQFRRLREVLEGN